MPITKLSLDINSKDEIGDSYNVGWDPTTQESLPISIVDRATRSEVSITGGRLSVATTQPAPPSGATLVDESATNTATATQFYTIPTGETLKIQRFKGGSQGGKQSRIGLWYDPDGTYPSGTSVLIERGYTSGNNFQFDLDEDFVGDGTARIALQLTRLDGGASEMYGKFSGYSQ